ncbi:RimK/LysX family protein [Luteibacter anthropi]|uniref:ATP-dependent zinc protease n=1 Tax=Luteibacter anthropi TaxID=564369 RepID=A0A7X5UDL0_9GAMM|nr:RimK/LysX family protein [Luteibacter anthropi]NII08312.1 ATP-dependent zinc protease [Luteibacter anthropi]URX64386.1 RimK/LysX family protein [Luteibacter anthropi]
MTDVITLGWRERLALPSLGIPVLKAKLDTGARSSSLHVEWLEVDERPDATWLRFQVRTTRRGGVSEPCVAQAIGRRGVTDSGGHSTLRWFIHADVELAGQSFRVEVNLTDRGRMLFPLLLGRTALEGRFLVDPSLSYSQTPRRAVREPT